MNEAILVWICVSLTQQVGTGSVQGPSRIRITWFNAYSSENENALKEEFQRVVFFNTGRRAASNKKVEFKFEGKKRL